MRTFLIVLIQMMVLSLQAAQGLEKIEGVEGPEGWVIEGIECSENKITSCSVLENELYLRPGDKVNEQEIDNARLRLKASGLFYDTQISLKKGSERGKVIVVIEVQERSATYVNVGVFSTASIQLPAKWSPGDANLTVGNRNLFGLGKRLSVSFSHPLDRPSYQSFNANYEDANLFGSNLYFGSLNYGRFFSESEDYRFLNENRQASFGRRLFDFSYIKATILNQRIRSGASRGEENENFYNSLSFEYGWNTKDDTFFPTSGSTFALGTSSFSTHAMYYLSDSFNYQLAERTVLDIGGRLSYSRASENSNSDIMASLGISRYYTFARVDEKIPDRMKVFARVNAFRYESASDQETSRSDYRAYVTGISYLKDSLGEMNFTLTIWDNQ